MLVIFLLYSRCYCYSLIIYLDGQQVVGTFCTNGDPNTDIRLELSENQKPTIHITHIFNTFFLLFLYTTDYLSVKNTEFKIRNHASLLHGQEAQIKSVPAMETGARK